MPLLNELHLVGRDPVIDPVLFSEYIWTPASNMSSNMSSSEDSDFQFFISQQTDKMLKL